MTQEFVTLRLRETAYVFRALALDQVQALEPQFEIIGTTQITGFAPPKEFLQAVVEIAHASLLYKQPEITVDQVRGLLTLGTLQLVIEAIRGVNALESAEGEAKAA